MDSKIANFSDFLMIPVLGLNKRDSSMTAKIRANAETQAVFADEELQKAKPVKKTINLAKNNKGKVLDSSLEESANSH
jgi:hypothetical protein